MNGSCFGLSILTISWKSITFHSSLKLLCLSAVYFQQSLRLEPLIRIHMLV